jgi:hypothetical protein
MHRIALTTAATLAILAAGSFASSRAETVTTPTGLRAVVEGANMLEDVAVRCRRVWRCGPYGCGWRRACWRTPYYSYYGSPNYGYYGYRGPYYGGYGYRPWRYW